MSNVPNDMRESLKKRGVPESKFFMSDKEVEKFTRLKELYVRQQSETDLKRQIMKMGIEEHGGVWLGRQEPKAKLDNSYRTALKRSRSRR
jgi:hypothetical protein